MAPRIKLDERTESRKSPEPRIYKYSLHYLYGTGTAGFLAASCNIKRSNQRQFGWEALFTHQGAGRSGSSQGGTDGYSRDELVSWDSFRSTSLSHDGPYVTWYGPDERRLKGAGTDGLAAAAWLGWCVRQTKRHQSAACQHLDKTVSYRSDRMEWWWCTWSDPVD